VADKDDDLYDTVSNMADRIGLKGGEKTKYVHDHMTRGGYKAVPQYVPADDKDDDEDDDDTPFFGRKRRKPRGGAQRRTRDDDDDDSWR
jgi:hypothetical protein